MGKQRQLVYIENIATTLMGQLRITDDQVGVDTYSHDMISGRIREKLHERVFCYIRHMKVETLAQILSSGVLSNPAAPREQAHGDAWQRLHSGVDRCTVNHVMYNQPTWLSGTESMTDCVDILRHCAATALVAAMYDIVVHKRLPKPKVV